MSAQTEFAAFMRELADDRKVDPLTYLKDVAATRNLADPDFRAVRAEALRILITRMREGTRLCDFQSELVFRPEGLFINLGGVLMECSHAIYHLKSTGPVSGPFAGNEIVDALRRRNVAVSTVVDIGANFGEVSLRLARAFPQARIVAVEPASANIGVLATNVKAQSFPTGGIEIVHAAITSRSGTVSIAKGIGTMNRVSMEGAHESFESVASIRLDELMDGLELHKADLVKIDIEGSEPMLRDAIVALGKRVDAYYIEFSQFAPFDDYIALAVALLSLGFRCHSESLATELRTAEEIAKHLRGAFAQGPIATTDLWFLQN